MDLETHQWDRNIDSLRIRALIPHNSGWGTSLSRRILPHRSLPQIGQYQASRPALSATESLWGLMYVVQRRKLVATVTAGGTESLLCTVQVYMWAEQETGVAFLSGHTVAFTSVASVCLLTGTISSIT